MQVPLRMLNARLAAEASAGSVFVADLEVPEYVVDRGVKAAQARGCTVIVDPSSAVRMRSTLYSEIDYLTPNPVEAEQLTGIAVRSVEDALHAGEILVKGGVRAACVKLSGGGCAVVSAEARAHVPSFRVTAIDTTGASDAFAGALGVALLEGRRLLEAVRFAVAAAAVAVTRYGAQPSYPTRAEVERLVATGSSVPD